MTVEGDPMALEHCEIALKEMTAERDLLLLQNREYLDHIEWAWGVIANAGPEGCMGNWKKLDPEWVKIAENWRDKYHDILAKREKRNHEGGGRVLIKLNGKDIQVANSLSYDDIIELAREREGASVIVKPADRKLAGFSVIKGQFVDVTEGMIIGCLMTGNA
jgi:hypothetical protein